MPRLSSVPLGSSSPGHAARQIRDLILAAVAETNGQREVHLAIDMTVVFRETHSTGEAPRDPHEGMGPRAAARLMGNFFYPISSDVQRTCNPRATHVQHHVQRDGQQTRNHISRSSVWGQGEQRSTVFDC